MSYLLLPGNSPRNKQWAHTLKKDLLKKGLDFEVIDWYHWEEGGPMQYTREYKRVSDKLTPDSVVIAKSIGTRLIADILVKEGVQVDKLIMLGVPSQNKQYLHLLETMSSESLVFIQNEHDPLQSHSKLEMFLEKSGKHFVLIKGGRDDHSYPFPDIISEQIKAQ
ncbi:MAG: hypothetical protein ACE5DX_00905 [Candidatus Dojkabacteria bacterium]